MSQFSRVLNFIISLCIYGVVALIPIFVLPLTPDVGELNKQFLMYFLVILGLVAWVSRGITERKLLLRHTPLDIPLALVVLTLLLSAIFSVDRFGSFWGNFSAPSNSFLSLIFYILFYFLVLNNIHSLRQVTHLLLTLIVSAMVSVLYFVNQVTGLLPLGASFPRWTVTSDLPSHLGYFLAVALIIVFSLVITKKKNFWQRSNILGLLAAAVIFGGLTMLGFKNTWLILAIAIFLFLVFSLSRLEEIHLPWISISFAILVISILFILLGTPQFLAARLPTEVTLAPGISWTITSATLSENLKSFLLGSGPGTFVYDFSRHRPEVFNNNFAWSLRFNKPYNTALELLTVGGLLNALGWTVFVLAALGIFFVTWFTRSLKIKRKGVEKLADLVHLADESGNTYAHTVFAGILTAWLTLFISMFFFSLTTVHWMLFFLFTALAFLVGLEFSKKDIKTFELSLKTTPQYTLVASFSYILVFALVLVLAVFLGRFYAAEVYKGQALKYSAAGGHDKAAASLFRAISLSPKNSRYYLDLASTYTAMAIAEAGKAEPNQQTIANLVASAVTQARQAAQLAPNDVSTWDFLAGTYATARPIAQNANNFVISSLEKAIELEKTNPRLYLELGRARVIAKDFKGGREALERAVALKSNYILGYTVLAQLDEMEGRVNEAIERASVAAALLPNDSTLLFNLGRLYYNRARSDDLVRAEQLYILAININPNYADAIWSLGVLYERQGKTSAALGLYRRVERLNPDNREVKRKIERLIAPAE